MFDQIRGQLFFSRFSSLILNITEVMAKLSNKKRQNCRPLTYSKYCIEANITNGRIADKRFDESAQDQSEQLALTREKTDISGASRRVRICDARVKRKALEKASKPPGLFPCLQCRQTSLLFLHETLQSPSKSVMHVMPISQPTDQFYYKNKVLRSTF